MVQPYVRSYVRISIHATYGRSIFRYYCPSLTKNRFYCRISGTASSIDLKIVRQLHYTILRLPNKFQVNRTGGSWYSAIARWLVAFRFKVPVWRSTGAKAIIIKYVVSYEWFYRTGTVSTYAFPCATHVFFSTVGTCVSACFFRKAGGRCIGTLYGTSTYGSKQPMPDGEPMVRRTLRST